MIPPEVPTVLIYAGDATVFPGYRFGSRDDDAGEFVPMDLTGWAFTAQWRPAPNDAKVVDLAVTVTDPTSGLVIMSMTGAQSATLTREGVFDLQGVKDGATRTFVRGRTRLTQDVTR